jgi:nitroreductase
MRFTEIARDAVEFDRPPATTPPMTTPEAIATRTSAVRLSEPGPSDEQIMTILNAGVRAPDHGRLTPWRFVVIEGAARKKLAQALAVHHKSISPDADDKRLKQEADKAFRAPAIIAVAARVVDHAKIPAAEQIFATAAAIQNMLLAAHSIGLGAIWKTGSPSRDPAVRAAIGFQERDVIVGFVYVGTVDRPAKPRHVDVTRLVSWL